MRSLIWSRRANAPMIRSVKMDREKAGKRKDAYPADSEANLKPISRFILIHILSYL